MSYCKPAFEGDFNLHDLKETNRFKREFAKAHPDYFHPDGLILFCGGQGEGKSLSAVRYISRVCKRYPKVQLCSNIALQIPDHEEVIPYEGMEAVRKMNNGYEGILLFLDEIQIEFSNLEKNYHPSIIQTVCQQRKRRLHIVGTTQMFKRLSKAWREQCNAIIDCKSWLNGRIQVNSLIDLGTIAEDSNGNLTTYDYAERSFWFRAKRYFDMYDTYQQVTKVKEVIKFVN